MIQLRLSFRVSLKLSKVCVTSLLCMFHCIDLSNQGSGTLIAYERKNGWVDIFIVLFAFFCQFKTPLISLFIVYLKLSLLLLIRLRNYQIVMSSVKKDIYTLCVSLLETKEQNFYILDDNNSNFNAIKLTQSF